MGKVEDALRDLIQYHSRRAAVDAVGDLPAQLRALRRDVRALSRTVQKLAGQVRGLAAARRREMAVPPSEPQQVKAARFSKRTLPGLRRRLDLTQQALAKLLEVSPATITAWETGKARPRAANMAQIVTLRGMGQHEVDRALGREAAPGSLEAAQLKAARRKLSLTQAELAALVGVSPASIAAWEAGRTAPSRKSRGALGALKELTAEEVNRRLGREAPAAGRPARPAPPLSPADVKAIRSGAGLTQGQLASRLGVSANSVSNWETGSSAPRPASVEKLLALKQ